MLTSDFVFLVASDSLVEGGGVLQGLQAEAPAIPRQSKGQANRNGSRVRHQRRNQRLPRELLRTHHRQIQAVHNRPVRGLPDRPGGRFCDQYIHVGGP